MTPIESMACGVPVIGVNDGGLRETIQDGKTGMLIDPQVSIQDLQNAVHEMTPEKSLAMKQDCVDQARKFGLEEFARQVREKMS